MDSAVQAIIRDARPEDLPAAATLAGTLLRHLRTLDPQRFPFLVDPPEPGFEAFLGECLKDSDYFVLVAELEGRVVGYGLASLEAREWRLLIDRHGLVQDIVIAPEARGGGTGERLLRALVDRLRRAGAPRIILHTPTENTAAQKLFRKVGFRETVREFYLE